MESKRSRLILEKLLKALTAQQVNEILIEENFTDDDWKPYGKSENNWDRAGNQQTNPISALTELITNSIDAILLRKAYERGIDVESEAAPQSMQDAVRDFYHVQEGKLSHLENRQLLEIAKKSILVGVKRAPRSKQFPTITIVDFGEGQKPTDFPNTFLSLSENNKAAIPFVQGKFNMGSTGCIRFCSRSELSDGFFKLIASKRYDEDEWG